MTTVAAVAGGTTSAQLDSDVSPDIESSPTGLSPDSTGKVVTVFYDPDCRVQSNSGESSPTLLESAVACWHELKQKYPERPGFSQDEFLEHAWDNWSRLCWFAKKHEVSKKSLRGKLRNGKLPSDSESLFCLANATGQWRLRWPVCVSSIPKEASGEGSKVSGGGGRRRGRPRTKQSTKDEGEKASKKVKVEKEGNLCENTDLSEIPEAWMALPCGPVRLSTLDKAEDIVLVDGVQVSGRKGFRSVRATHGVTVGDFYFEVEILDWVGDGAVRLGFSTRCSVIEGPVGFDCYGYGVRDRSGAFVHRSQLIEYGPSFGPGDVIGCRIHLPDTVDDVTKAEISRMELAWLKYRFQCFMQGRPPRGSSERFPESFVEFYKNGVLMGPVMPRGLPCGNGLLIGTYYPSVSVFKAGKARVNFGPHFKYDVPTGSRAFSECGTGEQVSTPRDSKPDCETLTRQDAEPPQDSKAPHTSKLQTGTVRAPAVGNAVGRGLEVQGNMKEPQAGLSVAQHRAGYNNRMGNCSIQDGSKERKQHEPPVKRMRKC